MSTQIPMRAQDLLSMAQQVVDLIDWYRKSEDDVYFEYFKEQYYKSLRYKVAQYFGMKVATEKELYDRMVRRASTIMFGEFPCGAYYRSRDIARTIWVGCEGAMEHGNDGGRTEILIDAGHFDDMDGVIARLGPLFEMDRYRNKSKEVNG